MVVKRLQSYQLLSSQWLFLANHSLLIQPHLYFHSPSGNNASFDGRFVSIYCFSSVCAKRAHPVCVAGVRCPKPVLTLSKRCAPCWPNQRTTSSASATARKPAACSETASTSAHTAAPTRQTRQMHTCTCRFTASCGAVSSRWVLFSWTGLQCIVVALHVLQLCNVPAVQYRAGPQ